MENQAIALLPYKETQLWRINATPAQNKFVYKVGGVFITAQASPAFLLFPWNAAAPPTPVLLFLTAAGLDRNAKRSKHSSASLLSQPELLETFL